MNWTTHRMCVVCVCWWCPKMNRLSHSCVSLECIWCCIACAAHNFNIVCASSRHSNIQESINYVQSFGLGAATLGTNIHINGGTAERRSPWKTRSMFSVHSEAGPRTYYFYDKWPRHKNAAVAPFKCAPRGLINTIQMKTNQNNARDGNEEKTKNIFINEN